MKKILSIVMALAIVLTMASFPAFAEEAAQIEVQNVIVDVDLAAGEAANVIDGNVGTYLQTVNITENGDGSPMLNIILDLGSAYNLTNVYTIWGGTAMAKRSTGLFGANSLDGEWTPIVETFSALTWKRDASTNWYYHGDYDITNHDGCYRYVKLAVCKIATNGSAATSGQVVLREFMVSGIPAGTGSDTEKVPTSYTVKYQSDDPDFPETADKVVSENVYVGDTVTEVAPAIDGYTANQESQTITLGEGENVITFTYTKGTAPAKIEVQDISVDVDLSSGPVENAIDGNKGTYFQTVSLPQINEDESSLFSVTLDLGSAYSLTNVYLVWGGTAMAKASTGLYGANSLDGEWTPIVESFSKLTWNYSAETNWYYIADYDITGSSEGYRYVKLVVNKLNKAGNATLREFQVTGVPAETGSEPDDEIDLTGKLTVNGAQIRLPDNGVKAGIRFGATLSPDLVGDVNEFEFDPTGDVKVGMFIIPVDLLGGMTFEQYLVANDYAGKALNVVAEHIYERNETKGITYTAVLTEIPASGYDKKITAIPYVCVNGEYQFAEQAEAKTYRGVAQAIKADHDNKEITLSPNQLDILAGIIG